MTVNGIWPVKFPGKRATNFFNGLRLGLCLILVFGSLSWWTWLNNNFWTIRSNLVSSGLEVQQINYILSDMAGLISGCIWALIVGSVLLIFLVLMQFSPVMDSLIHNNRTAKWGSTLAFIGIMFVGWGITDYVSYYNYHQTTHYLPPGPSPSTGILGAVLFVLGILLTVYAYTKGHKAITKV